MSFSRTDTTDEDGFRRIPASADKQPVVTLDGGKIEGITIASELDIDTIVVSASSSTTAQITRRDRSISETTSVAPNLNYQLAVVGKDEGASVEWTTSDPAVATVDASGLVTPVASSGTVKITVQIAGVLEASRTFEITNPADIVSEEHVGFIGSTVAAHLESTMQARVAGKTKADNAVFTSSYAEHAAGIYNRNPDCWAYGTDLTCISPWNSRGGRTRGGILISDQHAMFAEHYRVLKGDTVHFVDNDNNLVSRKVLDTHFTDAHLIGQLGGDDRQVVLLDSPVPASIKPAKILPADFMDYVSSLRGYSPPNSVFYQTGEHMQCAAMNQYEDIYPIQASFLTTSFLVNNNGGVPTWSSTRGHLVGGVKGNATGDMGELFDYRGAGDSGNPFFMIINGEVVALGCWFYGSQTASDTPTTGAVVPLIGGPVKSTESTQDAMDLLSTRNAQTLYNLTAVDLSGFDKF